MPMKQDFEEMLINYRFDVLKNQFYLSQQGALITMHPNDHAIVGNILDILCYGFVTGDNGVNADDGVTSTAVELYQQLKDTVPHTALVVRLKQAALDFLSQPVEERKEQIANAKKDNVQPPPLRRR